MSLTSFIEIHEIKDRLRQDFPKPELLEKREILAPSISKEYSQTGIAFDYLLRFHIEKINPKAVSDEWIAERMLRIMAGAREKIGGEKSRIEKDAEKVIKKARRLHIKYMTSNKNQAGNDLIKASIELAHLDEMYRGAIYYHELTKIFSEDSIKDLKSLLEITEPTMFKAKNICLLNPSFGRIAKIIGGADADLVIDDTLIDIKTTKHLTLKRKDFDQLLGYYFLHQIDGIGKIKPRLKITKLGIYFSRFGYLQVFEIKDIASPKTFTEFAKWFKYKAIQRDRAHREYRVSQNLL